MQLTPAQGAMKLLIGQNFARSGCTTIVECLKRGRQLLRQISGEDFGYDVWKWHEYLISTDAGGYLYNDNHLNYTNDIRGLKNNFEWQEAKQNLELLPEPPLDAPKPKFKWNDVVEVIISDQNKTYRFGRIRDRIWHHKQKKWVYYLEKHKKRYFEDDLTLHVKRQG